MPCSLSIRDKVTRTIGLVGVAIPVLDLNARWVKAVSLFKWIDKTVLRAGKNYLVD